MTLPKNITDALDAYAKAVEWTIDDARQHQHFEALAAVAETRAALEAAIADHIADAGKKVAPVEPPTDAEVEAWERMRERVQKALDANRSNPMIGTAVCAEEDCLRMVRGWIDEERGAGR